MFIYCSNFVSQNCSEAFVGTHGIRFFIQAEQNRMRRTLTKKSHSWWWDSHISPKNSKWLADNLEGKKLRFSFLLILFTLNVKVSLQIKLKIACTPSVPFYMPLLKKLRILRKSLVEYLSYLYTLILN